MTLRMWFVGMITNGTKRIVPIPGTRRLPDQHVSTVEVPGMLRVPEGHVPTVEVLFFVIL